MSYLQTRLLCGTPYTYAVLYANYIAIKLGKKLKNLKRYHLETILKKAEVAIIISDERKRLGAARSIT